jgi:N-acetylated-alpha-linked acidic dipeptidase
MARIDGIVALRLANADLLPYDVARYPADLARHLEGLKERAGKAGVAVDLSRLTASLGPLGEAAAACAAGRDRFLATASSTASRSRLNQRLLGLERAFMYLPGLPSRPWNRSLYIGVDPFNGYDAWPLPGLRHQVEVNAPEAVPAWEETYVQAVTELTRRLQELAVDLTPLPRP